MRRNAGKGLEAGPGFWSQGAGCLSPGSQSALEMLPGGARVERGAESGLAAPEAANTAPQAEVADGLAARPAAKAKSEPKENNEWTPVHRQSRADSQVGR